MAVLISSAGHAIVHSVLTADAIGQVDDRAGPMANV